MEKFRIGNTLLAEWPITVVPFAELASLNLRLEMTLPNGEKVTMPFTIEDGNVINMYYQGKDQKHLGKYRLTLWHNESVDNQHVIDACDAFQLVPCTCKEGGEPSSVIGVRNVEILEGTLEIGAGSVPNSVLYVPQELTEEQQAQARANINAKKGGYSRIEKIHDYIHEIWYDGVDYGFADLMPHTPLGACTSIRKGKFFARNLDWQYSECCEFFIHTPAADGRHAVDGFGGNIPALTKSVVESGAWNAAYNWLPLSIADGHNDAGLCCSMNVVPTKTAPNTYEKTTGTNPSKPTINGLMIVRYILDNHTDALAAAEDVRDNWNVVMPHTDTFDEELHFLIADKTQTIVLEFIGNEAKIIADNAGIITNFRMYGVNDWNDIEPFGQGVERWFKAAELFDGGVPVAYKALLNMSQLFFTHAYNDDDTYNWLTEFAGLHDELTVQAAADTPSVYDATLAAAHQAYLDRTRDGETWQTTHSVVYDIENGECIFIVQQDWTTRTQRDMVLPIDAYTKAETDALLEEKADVDDTYTKSEINTALATKVDKVNGKGLSTNDYTNADKDIVDGVTSALEGKQDTISDLSDIRSGASSGATAVQPDDLPTFGDIVTHNADEFLPSSTEIPTKTSDLTNDSDYTTQTYVDGLVGNILTILTSI